MKRNGKDVIKEFSHSERQAGYLDEPSGEAERKGQKSCKGKRPSNFLLTSLPFLFTFLFLFTSCGPRKGWIRIRGEFENLPQADLLIYSPDGGLQTIDTLHILKGKFDYQTKVDDGEHTYVIIYPNFSTLSFQTHSGTDIHITGDALSLSQVKVEGADSILTAEKPKSRKPLAIGRRLPKSKIIKKKPGTYLLINFWAEWKHGSSVVNYYTRQALRDHPDSLYVFSYSLDVDPTVVKKAESIEDSTKWHTYCDYQGWGGSLLTKFGIRNIPLMILVNPKDTIIAMGTDYNKDIKPEIDKIQLKKKP